MALEGYEPLSLWNPWTWGTPKPITNFTSTSEQVRDRAQVEHGTLIAVDVPEPRGESWADMLRDLPQRIGEQIAKGARGTGSVIGDALGEALKPLLPILLVASVLMIATYLLVRRVAP